MAATKERNNLPKMPRACPVEFHVGYYKKRGVEDKSLFVAAKVKRHGASPWHPETLSGIPKH